MRAWLLLISAALAGCATVAAGHGPAQDCEAGSASSCAEWGERLLIAGDPAGAERAFGQACDRGLMGSCITLGRLLMARGALVEAEVPLRKAYLEEEPEAWRALAELHDARGGPENAAIALNLRFEAPAVDKPNVEFITQFRLGATGIGETTLGLNLQPMAFWARRFSVGAMATLGPVGEFDALFGYQHFVNEHVTGYARAVLGGLPAAPLARAFNVGAELGVKLCLGPLGHLELAMGTSRGSPFHVSVGLGFNAVFLLLAALH